MKVQIQKWGNSLALRIPKAFANETHIENNSVVDLSIKGDLLIISPVQEIENYSLSSLLSEINDENIHESIDFGSAVGKELF